MQNLVEGERENDFLQISGDSCGKDLFLEINILRAVSGDLFVTNTSTIGENDICFSAGGGHLEDPSIRYW